MIKTANKTGLIDIPNNRSSHIKPTPSSGGLALVIIILLANKNFFYICPEFFIGGIITAIVGLIDDYKSLPVYPRLIIQFLVVGLMIIFLPVDKTIIGIPMIITKTILFFAGVWFINIYNFMDGIDGLAGGYANAASIGFLYCINNSLTVESWNVDIYFQIIFITIPFLIFNWSPAKIFMGDIGSTFLGFTFFSLGIRGLIFSNYIIYSFIIIMSFFWIDASITLVRRIIKKRKFLSAHKEHAFQKASAIFGHWKVTCFIVIITLIWLNPMANFAISNAEYAPIISLIAILPILIIILIFKPGLPVENQSIILKVFPKRFKNNNT